MPRSAAAALAVADPGSEDRPPRPRLGWIAGAVGVVTLGAVTLAHPSATRIHTWPWAAIGFGLWILPLVVLSIGAARCPFWRLPARPFLAGLIVLAVGTLAAALVSPFASASLPRVWPTLGGVALLLWLYHSWSVPIESRKPIHDHVARLIAGGATALTLVCLLGWSGASWPLPWSARNDIPFGHSTYTAGAMVALLPWVALQAWTHRGFRRLAWLAAVAAMVLVLASTSSRGGVLGLAVAATFATLAVLLFSHASRRQKISVLSGLIALAALVVATNPRLRELVMNREWGESASESNTQRSAMIAAGLKLGAERPVLGWGSGTVPLAYPRVRASLDAGVENVLQLHSTPVQVWATHGAVGLAALLLLTAGFAASRRRAPRDSGVTAAAASLIGYAAMALTDHQMDVPLIAATVVAGAAFLLASSPPAIALHPTRGMRLAGVASLAIVAGVPLTATWRDLQARAYYDDALSAFETGHEAAALTALDHATRATPHDPFFDHLAAATQIKAASGASNPEQGTRRIRDSITRLERSLATGAHLEFAHFNLGWLYLGTGEAALATRHFRAAAALVPDKGGVYFGLGLALRATGAQVDAVRAFALEWVNDPLSFTSPVWEIDEFAPLIPEIRKETLRLLHTLPASSPPAPHLAAWLSWWWQPDSAASPPPPAGWNAESRAFVAAWPLMQTRTPLPPETPRGLWTTLYEAWQTSAPAAAFTTAAGGDAAFAAALARRAGRHPTDFPAFLVRGTAGDAPLVRVLQRTRPGYGVLALHPEGPPLQDAYVVQENRVATQFAAALFPRKGWLPGRFLLALLPGNSR